MMSINTATDSGQMLVESLWKDLCMRLRKVLLGKLSELPRGQVKPDVDLYRNTRINILQNLCALFPKDEIWGRYWLVFSLNTISRSRDPGLQWNLIHKLVYFNGCLERHISI